MSNNSGNQQQQQQGFYGTGFGTNGAGGQLQQSLQHQNTNGTGPTVTTANNGSTYGPPPSYLNANVPTPGGGGPQSTPTTTTAGAGANGGAAAQPFIPTTTTAAAEGGAPAAGQATTMNSQQQQQAKELNAASLCRYGQETVQEIVSRTQELYQTLRGAQPPDGKQQQPGMDRKPKFQETLRNIRGLYKRLRVIYDKIEESFPASTDLPLEERIPFEGSGDLEPMDEKRDTETYRAALEEYEEVKEMVVFKNRHLRETLDLMRNIIWDVNTMLAMRKE